MGRKRKAVDRDATVVSEPITAPWFKLPYDVRYMIFEALWRDCRRQVPEKESRKLRKRIGFQYITEPYPLPRASVYAAVNKEWQEFFEVRIFERICISQFDLDEFEFILHPKSPRRALVKHVWLNLELSKYVCGESPGPLGGCRTYETVSTMSRNEHRFHDGTKRLMEILSGWQLNKDNAGITLELSAYSPSDIEHYFKLHRFRRDYDPYKFSNDYRPVQQELFRNGTGEHCWHPYRIYSHPRCGHTHLWLGQTLSHAMGSDPLEWPMNTVANFGSVGIAVKFLIRRQFVRLFNPDSISDIISRLPNLEDIRIEQWRYPEEAPPRGVDRSWERLIIGNLNRPTIKSLSLFEDTDDHILERPFGISRHSAELSRLVARSTRHLQHIHCTFYVDAKEFFKGFMPVDGKFMVCPGQVSKIHDFIDHRDRFRPAGSPTMGDLDPPVHFKLDDLVRNGIGEGWMEEPIQVDTTKPLTQCDCQAEWPNLETLALTSRIFDNDSPHGTIDKLLHAAANAACRMPRLRTMELWNYDEGQCFIFTYNIEDCTRATINLQYRWPNKFSLSNLVRAKWHKVAQMGRRKLQITETQMNDEIVSRQGALGLLTLRKQIMHPVSAFEIMREAPKDPSYFGL